jgi:hypothetical protein
MSLVKTIVGIIILAIILHLIFSWFFSNGTTITGMEPATKASVIAASTLPDNNTSNFTYSTWFYVNDWNYEFGKPKILLERKNSATATTFKISLGATENNIDIDVLCYSSSGSAAAAAAAAAASTAATADAANCPVQCRTCWSGKNYAGGTALTNGTCTNYCNQQRICGTTAAYKISGVDCTKCTPTVPPAGTNANTNWPGSGIDDGITTDAGTNLGGDCTVSLYGCCPGAVGTAKTTIAKIDAAGTNCARTLVHPYRCKTAAAAAVAAAAAACGSCRRLCDDQRTTPACTTHCSGVCCAGTGLESFGSQGTSKWHKCTIRNFPLQKWVNLTVSLYGRTLDVYIDGKLVRTCILPGVAKSGTGGSILITPGKGFSGWTSQTKYFADATNPQEAYGIYKQGYGGSIIGNLFNKYRVRVSFLEDNQSKGSFEL